MIAEGTNITSQGRLGLIYIHEARWTHLVEEQFREENVLVLGDHFIFLCFV